MISQDPLWYKDVIIYQLHVKSFFDSNDDGYGDFQGLVQKLDYIEDLGVNCVWLMPFYPSPLKDDGYDISDYESINPMYGNIRDFRTFVREAHTRGIRVITELVINHTSDQHPWFQAARKAPKGSYKRDFYVWSDTAEKYQDARIIFLDFENSNWTWDATAGQYYWHRFYHHQPDLNFDNPSVRAAVARVMRFWLDMGVDGMRLDAIPYLIEREGTNCENLPETHQVIKELRSILDKEYDSRFLLAEANQWPSQVIQYFGNSDECHMAYHFPVMPRIFMALHQEDRHPITEILNQTPEIPGDCQWAMFLRNHDELTLEMVSDAERDYMWRVYASDPLMRINLGIRRRLAPLLQHSRPRIELLISILFSMQGTPIIYYGDELGMGDNIFLGDRHGVRTPMQWSLDRNGGFSRAPFAKLYAQPIMDPVTGYQSVNVEAQQLDPSSLLNWMKSIIRLRKQHKLFGRGSIELLYPENRKILAYFRNYQDETVLVVCNLSRHPQPVLLDLSRFQGLTPVEMFGLVPFPKIDERPYTLTLGGYAFYWLLLQSAKPMPVAAPPSVHEEHLEMAPARSPLVYNADLSEGLHSILRSEFRQEFESSIIPWYVSRQRWFGKKSQLIADSRIVDLIELAEHRSALIIVELSYAQGGSDLYSLFLSLELEAGQSERAAIPESSIIARLQGRHGESAVLYSGLDDPNFSASLLALMQQNKRIAADSGVLEFRNLPSLSELIAGKPQSRRIVSEQSNSSVVVGEHLIFKLFRHIEAGVNPDYEICHYLRAQTEFVNIPRIAGVIEYRPQDTPELYTLGILQEFITNQGDGWNYTIDALRRAYERSSVNPRLLEQITSTASFSHVAQQPVPADLPELLGVYLKDAETLGVRTGQMHVALANVTSSAAFRAEPLTKDDLIDQSLLMRGEIEKNFQLLGKMIDTVPAEVSESSKRLLSAHADVLKHVDRLPGISGRLQKIRCHGDFHLGQTLYRDGDFIIIDFEGEPGKSLSRRRTKQSPLRDVAGMLRSFSYAAYASLLLFTHNSPDQFNQLLPWAKAYEKWICAAYLNGYLTTVEGQSFIPRHRDEFFRMLVPFILEKGFYEVGYELNNRPDWIKIPVTSLLDFIRENVLEIEYG